MILDMEPLLIKPTRKQQKHPLNCQIRLWSPMTEGD
jgi:hypothetical protein